MNQMMQMFTQMMCMPMNVFADAMSRSVQGMQALPAGSSGGALAPVTQALTAWTGGQGGCQGDGGSCCTTQPMAHGAGCGCGACSGGSWNSNEGGWNGGTRCGTCGQKESDCCCRKGCNHCGSNEVQLVEYSVVNLRRSADRRDEHPVQVHQVVLDECMSPQEFQNWVIVQYAKNHPGVDGKNLRVYCKVLDTWCKPDWDYQERQIETLEGIRAAIADKRA
jgi:hypothetical protein